LYDIASIEAQPRAGTSRSPQKLDETAENVVIPAIPAHAVAGGRFVEAFGGICEMKLFGPLARAAAVAGLVSASVIAPAPSFAGPAELALLESYIGGWSGRGQLVGAETETVVCKLDITKGNQQRVNYAGRCAVAGRTLAVRGTMAYFDESRRFEAAMSSNIGFKPAPAIGRKDGNGILFNLRERGEDEEGNDMTIVASMLFRPTTITVNIDITFNDSGDTLRASVPFTK
jgi:hypothetical protein